MPELFLNLLLSACYGGVGVLLAQAARTGIVRLRMRQEARRNGAPFVKLQMEHQVLARSRAIDLAPGITVMHRLLVMKNLWRKSPRKADITYAAGIVSPNVKIQRALQEAYLDALIQNRLSRVEGSWDSGPIQKLPTPRAFGSEPDFPFYLESSSPTVQVAQYADQIPGASEAEPLTHEEASTVSATSVQSLDHALGMLFIRLGPPPEPSAIDYEPASNGGGGVQQ